jgi:hypothetical protein
LQDLCPPGDGMCSSVAFQAELIPKPGSSLPPRGPAAMTAASVPVHFGSTRQDLTVLMLVREDGQRRQAWEPICHPPCDTRMPAQASIAIALDAREPIELSTDSRLVPDARLEVRYDDRRAQRNVARVAYLAGIAAAITMLAVGAPGDRQPWHASNVALVAGGFTLLFGSQWLLFGPASQPDSVRVAP